MKIQDNLPTAYVAPKELVVCTNAFQNVEVPIAVDGFPAVLVSLDSSGMPLVWLAAPVPLDGTERRGQQRQWNYIVSSNRPFLSIATVKQNPEKKEVLVSSGGQDVIRVVGTGPDTAAVQYLNMKPLGMNIRGTSSGLTIGGNTLSGNTVSGASVGIAVGSSS